MFCTKCGSQISDTASYCAECGHLTPYGRERYSGPAHAPRRIFRLRDDKMIAGICAGFAHYFGMDVTLVRILAVIVTCITGFLPGVVAYLIVWAIMPVEENRPLASRPAESAPAPSQ